MGKIRIATYAAAAIAMALLLASGPLTKAGILDWRIGLSIFSLAAWLGMAAALAALIQVVVPAWRRPAPLRLAVALAVAVLAALPPLLTLSKAKRVPAIHDITTDFTDPPAFAALAEARRGAPNGVAYGGPEVAALQRGHYDQVYPVVVKQPPAEAFQKALDAARACGWQVVASDAAAGRIEATDTTAWFGFKDDVVIRVRAVDGGSRIDARSVSRVGRSDLGANAARLTDFLKRLS